jgi:predicted transcriptional regulator
MGTKESLHALVDSLTDEEADQLLELALTDFGPAEPLNEADIASIRRGLEDIARGRVFTTEEVLRHVLER